MRAAPLKCWSDSLITSIFINYINVLFRRMTDCTRLDRLPANIYRQNFLRKKTTFMVLAAITVERNSSSSEPLDCKKYQMEGPHDSSSFALSPPALVHSQSRGPLQGTAGTLKVNFQKCQAVLCYILIDKQMLH